MDWKELLKNAIKIAQQSDNIELYKQLIELNELVLKMQEEKNQLTSELTRIKKERDLEEKMIRHQEAYITLEDDVNEIKYCAICWGTDKQLIQMNVIKDLGNIKLRCHKCKNHFYLDRNYNSIFYE